MHPSLARWLLTLRPPAPHSRLRPAPPPTGHGLGLIWHGARCCPSWPRSLSTARATREARDQRPAGDAPSRPDPWPALPSPRGDPSHFLPLSVSRQYGADQELSTVLLLSFSCVAPRASSRSVGPHRSLCPRARPSLAPLSGFANSPTRPSPCFHSQSWALAASAGWVRDCFVWSVVELEV